MVLASISIAHRSAGQRDERNIVVNVRDKMGLWGKGENDGKAARLKILVVKEEPLASKM